MSLKMSRRGFVKASAVATASTLLLGASATAAAADEAAATSTSSDDVKIIPSACRQCYGRCALFGHVKDGRLVKIEGNPDLFSEGTLCGRCYTGKCPWGIATNESRLKKRQNPDEAARRLTNLVRAWGHEIQEMLGGMGLNSIESLRGNRDKLRGIGLGDTELDILGIKHAGR